ncbi:RtcB family protein [Solidesulfovibrio sp.]|uniref:RtcB family protein n=1 Tax=Solidesulfovibrio sp. TaxID=2910990 RepID=UPI002B1F7DCC|nr:RtcB family protein [Solidesulfovibrio sp.]MEA5088400.1 RtcB family protein [Solidesulfovibrio sp.]HML59446.1 RtcB family protein [Solidesulfovibrio sp.]
MGRQGLTRQEAFSYEMAQAGAMRVPARIFGSPAAVAAMEDGVFDQLRNVASLPGVASPVVAMPDAHAGYGFPIGCVAAFDPEAGGVVSAGGVGFDIACGVRTLLCDCDREDVEPVREALADALFALVPAGLGTSGALRLSEKEMDRMLAGGAAWAVERGFGEKEDLARIEDGGRLAGADPDAVSQKAKERQRDALGTLGSGNHYLEVQYVDEVRDARAATALGIRPGQAALSIHCGSRGLGHQTATEHIAAMLAAAPGHGLVLPDPELACAPADCAEARRYLGAMRAAANCALAGRQVITHLCREAFARFFPGTRLRLLYDVSHNLCRSERHAVDGRVKTLLVHRKGATRALGPHHPDLPAAFRGVGQPVIVGGSMGTASAILTGTDAAESLSFSSACHGAGRAMSRKQALKRFNGRGVLQELAARGVSIRAHDLRGLGEEAPGAYKDIEDVVAAVHALGLATTTARLRPLACIKG